MVDSNLITLELVHDLRTRNRNYVIPNLYLGNWECDVYCETQVYSEEYEIKVSVADYYNDFKKKFIKRSGEEVVKHNLIQSGRRTNRFWYVAPMGLLKQSELILPTMIPKYAGLIYFSENEFQVIKSAPLLSKEHLLHPEEVRNASYYRYVHYSSKYNSEIRRKLK